MTAHDSKKLYAQNVKLRDFVERVAESKGVAIGDILQAEARSLISEIDSERDGRGSGTGERNRKEGEENRERFRPLIRQAIVDGANSFAQIAAALNAQGIPAPRGGEWKSGSVHKISPYAFTEFDENGKLLEQA